MQLLLHSILCFAYLMFSIFITNGEKLDQRNEEDSEFSDDMMDEINLVSKCILFPLKLI